MTERYWQRITDISDWNHRCLEKDDLCLFYRVKEKHVYGQQFSQTNSIIQNFKKKPSLCRRDPLMSRYKEEGIAKITDDVIRLFANSDKSFALVPAITSKAIGDSEYDDRLICVCERVAGSLPNVSCANLLSVRNSMPTAHSGGGSRNIADIRNIILVEKGFDFSGFDFVLIFDDVLTTGAHFKACQSALFDEYGFKAAGLFWAREENAFE